MIVLPPVIELGNVVIVDPGIPNRERIVFRPTDHINLALCGILVGVQEGEGTRPVSNLFFWFGEMEIKPPSWILVFTGKGENKLEHDKSGNPMHIFYWGSTFTFFGFKGVIPIVFRMAGLTFGHPLIPLPQWTEGAVGSPQ